MKLPRRIAEALNRKEVLLNDARGRIEKVILNFQSDLYEDVLTEIIQDLQTSDGAIIDNADNYRVVMRVESLYRAFTVRMASVLLNEVNSTTTEIIDVTNRYFTSAMNDLPARFDRVIESTKTLIDLKIGLRQGKMIRGGMISQILNIPPQELQSLMSKAVASQMEMKDFITAVRNQLKGNEAKAGVYDRQLKRFAYDTYQQYDAAYNKKLAEEFEMRYFVYQGGLVEDSRDFCAAHNNKVWSVEEAQEWPNWTPSKGEYPAGYEVKAKDLYAVPSYIDYPGYDPLTDRGGYNCRHIIGFITDGLAMKLRPGLNIP